MGYLFSAQLQDTAVLTVYTIRVAIVSSTQLQLVESRRRFVADVHCQ